MGLDLKLNDCQVLKEESTVESKSLVDIENLEEFNSNDIVRSGLCGAWVRAIEHTNKQAKELICSN